MSKYTGITVTILGEGEFFYPPFCPKCCASMDEVIYKKRYTCDCLLRKTLERTVSKEFIDEFMTNMNQRFVIETYLHAGDDWQAAREIYKLHKGHYPEEEENL